MASSYGTDAEKGVLRARYKALRSRMPHRERVRADALICSHLFEVPPVRRADLMLVYISTDDEVDTAPIVEGARARGMRVAAPRMERSTHELAFFEIESLGDLEPGAFGIMEPARARTDALEMQDMVGSVCLVPGLVFDAQGHRVGYGAGCYDRFCSMYPGEKVGLAHTVQVSSNPLPIEPHDVAVDWLVTDRDVWECYVPPRWVSNASSASPFTSPFS
ncbi:MAG: 5-formyltetrahydrofolate cyclo-ligase [Coriobacteriaceae bacterium]|nr:5-formyltetrahydrofolate cyclo-ligase [Coriobacteriaceae bacterium]